MTSSTERPIRIGVQLQPQHAAAVQPSPRRGASLRGHRRRRRLQLGPLLPAVRRPGRRALRMLDDARRLGRADLAHRDRRAGDLQLLPQPRAARRHGPHRRPHLRRQADPRHRIRLEEEGLRRVRLRVRHRGQPARRPRRGDAAHRVPARQAQSAAASGHPDPDRRRRGEARRCAWSPSTPTSGIRSPTATATRARPRSWRATAPTSAAIRRPSNAPPRRRGRGSTRCSKMPRRSPGWGSRC